MKCVDTRPVPIASRGLSPFVRRLLLPLSMLALSALVACGVPGKMGEAADLTELTPEAVISFNYPTANPWILNSLAVFTPDGRYLIDGAGRARYLQVWDWKTNKLVKRLLLNENAPEIEIKADMRREELGGIGEPGWAFSPDGKYFAVCTNIKEEPAKPAEGRVITVRVWNMEQGIIAANIFTIHRNIPGISGNAALVHAGCESISFSPDGKQMLMTTQSYGGHVYANRNKLVEKKADGRTYGLLYDTASWQPAAALRNPDILEDAISPGLYDRADGKTIYMLLRQRPNTIAISEKLQKKGNPTPEQADPFVRKRLVVFDANTGEIAKSIDLPELTLRMLGADGPIYGLGIKWSWLGESVNEIYWNLIAFSQSKEEYSRCSRLNAVEAPSFFSNISSDCAHVWQAAVLNIESQKIRFIAPIKRKRNLEEYEASGVSGAKVRISPNGEYLLLIKNMGYQGSRSFLQVLEQDRKLEVYHLPTSRLVGSFRVPNGYLDRITFSQNSRFMILPDSRDAAIYDLTKMTQAQ